MIKTKPQQTSTTVSTWHRLVFHSGATQRQYKQLQTIQQSFNIKANIFLLFFQKALRNNLQGHNPFFSELSQERYKEKTHPQHLLILSCSEEAKLVWLSNTYQNDSKTDWALACTKVWDLEGSLPTSITLLSSYFCNSLFPTYNLPHEISQWLNSFVFSLCSEESVNLFRSFLL